MQTSIPRGNSSQEIQEIRICYKAAMKVSENKAKTSRDTRQYHLNLQADDTPIEVEYVQERITVCAREIYYSIEQEAVALITLSLYH